MGIIENKRERMCRTYGYTSGAGIGLISGFTLGRNAVGLNDSYAWVLFPVLLVLLLTFSIVLYFRLRRANPGDANDKP
jgi:hypothetical protein